MNRILVLTLICAAMSAGAGCKPLWLRSGSDKEPSQTPEQKQIKQLQGDVATLKDQLVIRDSQQEQLRSRADKLAKMVMDLEFANQEQANQIKVLSHAPLARDEYKALAEQLKISLERITVRLAQLEASNKVLTLQVKRATGDEAGSTILPTTAPAMVMPTTAPTRILPTTVLPTTGPAMVIPTAPPATVLPTTGPAMVMPATGPVTTEPAPGEEF